MTLTESSFTAPGIAPHDGRLVLAWAGPHKINVLTSYDGHRFFDKVTLDEKTVASPALASVGGRLFLAWTGTDSDGHLNLLSSYDGVNWASKVMDQFSSDGPALAGTMAISSSPGPDGAIGSSTIATADGRASPTGYPQRGRHRRAGARLVRRKTLHGMDRTDSNGFLNVIAAADGFAFRDKVTLQDVSSAAPALSVDGPLWTAWTGVGTGS